MELKNADKKSINELYGIIQGIEADKIINEKEIAFLQEWLIDNKNYEKNDLLGEIYKELKQILEDNKISKEEKEQLLKMCETIKEKFVDKRDCFSNLLGIIQGISCDKKINETELELLSSWLDNNALLHGHLIYDKVYEIVKRVLADGIISSEEEKELLNLFDTIIISKREYMMINYAKFLIKQGKNIGNHIIAIYGNEKLVQKIHLNAKAELLKALNRSTAINFLDTEIIFISLCLIALENYDGNFYDYVVEEYVELYDNYTRQRIDGIIRSIIKKYIKDETVTRQINYVLENTLVPLKFLSNYFDFVFDIYKINFQFLLDEKKIDEDVEFVFNGLKDVFNEDSDDISIEVTNKTYKLIRTTKNIIYNKDSVIALRNLTKKVLKIIDNYYWNNVTEIEDKYYKEGFNNWIDKNNKEVSEIRTNLREDRETLRSRWLPTFRLVDHTIFLHIPEHKIKNDYEYSDIKIRIYQNNKKIQEISDFRIFSIIGGYKIEVPDIKIDHPLDNIQYRIETNSEVIYDSNNILKNSYILFNEKGISINPNKSYEGNLYIVYRGNVDENISIFYQSDNYCIGSIYIKNDTILKINEEYITFNTEIISGIVGTIYNDTFINYENRNIRVYKSIHKIIFETETSLDEIGLKINERRYRLDELEYSSKSENGKNIIYVSYSPEENTYYDLNFFNTISGKNIKAGKYEFFIDSNLECEVEKLDKNNYNIVVESNLIKNNKEFLLNIKEFDHFSIETDYHGASYILPLEVPMYRIDEQPWKSVEDYMWIEDITIDSVLYIQGIEMDELFITNQKGETLTRLKAFKKDNIYKIPIGNLRTYADSTEKIYMLLRKDSEIKQLIECYMKCVINESETLISFDSETEDLLIKIKIFGKGTFKLIILSESNKILYEKLFENNTFTTKIKNLQVNKLYKFRIDKVATGFSLDGDVKIYEHQEKFYSYKSLEGKNIKVKSVDFDIFDRFTGELIRKTFFLHRTYFHIEKYLGNKKYIAKIYKWEGVEDYLENINPVEIELSSDIESDNIEVAAYKEGDGLLIDFNNKSILDSMEDLKAADIYSCKLILR